MSESVVMLTLLILRTGSDSMNYRTKEKKNFLKKKHETFLRVLILKNLQ